LYKYNKKIEMLEFFGFSVGCFGEETPYIPLVSGTVAVAGKRKAPETRAFG